MYGLYKYFLSAYSAIRLWFRKNFFKRRLASCPLKSLVKVGCRQSLHLLRHAKNWLSPVWSRYRWYWLLLHKQN